MDKYIRRKGYNPDVNLKLFKEEEEKIKGAKNAGQEILQGIEYNIQKFKNYTQQEVKDAVADLVKVKRKQKCI